MAEGSVNRAGQMGQVVEAGADFCVSPGISKRLLSATASAGKTSLHGVSTISDVLLSLEHGLEDVGTFILEELQDYPGIIAKEGIQPRLAN